MPLASLASSNRPVCVKKKKGKPQSSGYIFRQEREREKHTPKQSKIQRKVGKIEENMVYVPEITWADTPELVVGLAVAMAGPVSLIMELVGCSPSPPQNRTPHFHTFKFARTTSFLGK